ncbi:MAG TPA: RIP metalloprotease RseP [Candidatus Acidoferrum sp.]|nr:RIP metalloprotease RseP [Candidatus Acidoferrum sp.]
MDLLLGVALVLGVMILVHEWGHFIAARIFGVRVDVFSIGFGPRLFGWKRGATDYRVSALPLGGYVRMAGQDPSEIDSANSTSIPGKEKDKTYAPYPQLQALVKGAPDELMSKPRWQRALISFAGPFVNLIFPVLLLTVYFVTIGIPYPAYQDKPVEVTAVPANSPAARAGLRSGDKIVALEGEQNPNWEQAEKVLTKLAPNSKLSMEVEEAGSRRSLTVPVEQKDIDQPERLLERLFGYVPIRPILEDVAPGYPAQRAGLKENDLVSAVDGQKIQWWGEFTDRIRASNGKPVALDVDRKGQSLHLVVTPQAATNERGETIYQIGVQVHEDTAYKRVAFPEGARYAGLVTVEKIKETAGIVGKLFSGRVSLKQLQGPVGISRAAGQAARKGPLAIISLMVLISVNLGILNLLPIPILDGGHILLLAIEGGLRRDLSLAFKERFVQVGLVFLLVVFAIVMYNDVVRLLPIHS